MHEARERSTTEAMFGIPDPYVQKGWTERPK
jgi:hypothetical protein